MAGSVVEKDQAVDLNVPEWIIGDAELSFDLAMLELDATFSNIVALESGTPLPISNGPASRQQRGVQAGRRRERELPRGRVLRGQPGRRGRRVRAGFDLWLVFGDGPDGRRGASLTDVDSYAVENLTARPAATGEVPDFTVEEYIPAVVAIFDDANTFLAGNRIASWTETSLLHL